MTGVSCADFLCARKQKALWRNPILNMVPNRQSSTDYFTSSLVGLKAGSDGLVSHILTMWGVEGRAKTIKVDAFGINRWQSVCT